MTTKLKLTIKFDRSISLPRRKDMVQDIKQVAANNGFAYLMPMTKDEYAVELWFGDIRKSKKGDGNAKRRKGSF